MIDPVFLELLNIFFSERLDRTELYQSLCEVGDINQAVNMLLTCLDPGTFDGDFSKCYNAWKWKSQSSSPKLFSPAHYAGSSCVSVGKCTGKGFKSRNI